MTPSPAVSVHLLLDHRGQPLEPSWFTPHATRIDALRGLRAQAKLGHDPSLDAALYYCDWPLVTRLLEARLEAEPGAAALHATLGLALLRQGDAAGARDCSLRAALLAPACANVVRLEWELANFASRRRQAPPIPAELCRLGRVRVDLLGVEHWDDLVWQYDDPNIERLCRWPRLACFDEFEQFLAQERANGDVLVFAVVEASSGFCGAVSLVFHEGVGFVSYWLGREFRGQGLASEAVECVLRLAGECFGMHACYATVLADNLPSRRVLSRLGFEELALEPLPPYSAERVYRRGTRQPESSVRKEAVRLFANMRSFVQLELCVAA